jgi:hypothetical protein
LKVRDEFRLKEDGSLWILEIIGVHEQSTLFKKNDDHHVWIGLKSEILEFFEKAVTQ